MKFLSAVACLFIVLAVAMEASAGENVPTRLGGFPVSAEELAFYEAKVPEKKAMEAIARNRAIQMLAKEEGIIADVEDYGGWLEAFHAENARRRDMKARDEVFYGPVQFRQDVWFDVRTEQLVRALYRKVRVNVEDSEKIADYEQLARDTSEERIARVTDTLLMDIDPPQN